jgi:hypothetical protein
MKISGLVIVTIFALGLSSCSSPKTTAQFYHTHKVKEGVKNFKIPGWLMWLGGGIAKASVKDPDAKVALKLAKKVGKMRILVSEDANVIDNREIMSFIGHAEKRGYEPLIQVRDGETLVNIMARDKKDKLKNLLIMVSEEDSFVFLDMKSRIKYEEISDLINYFINRERENNTIELKDPVTPPKKEEKPKPTKPRA